MEPIKRCPAHRHPCGESGRWRQGWENSHCRVAAARSAACALMILLLPPNEALAEAGTLAEPPAVTLQRTEPLAVSPLQAELWPGVSLAASAHGAFPISKPAAGESRQAILAEVTSAPFLAIADGLALMPNDRLAIILSGGPAPFMIASADPGEPGADSSAPGDAAAKAVPAPRLPPQARMPKGKPPRGFAPRPRARFSASGGLRLPPAQKGLGSA